jgi:hypothetical protein
MPATAPPRNIGDDRGAVAQPAADPPSDLRVLGLPENADWDDIQAAYERLTLRSDPRRFPDGSSSQHEARRITERIHAAYERLRDRYDPTESRFAKLEFDAPTPENTPASTPPRPPIVPPELS